MTEINKSGVKDFFIVLLAIFIAGTIVSAMSYMMPNHKLLANVISIVVFCIIAYFVFTRYTAVFEYKLDDEKLYAQRKIGSKIASFEVKLKDIKDVCFPKDKPNLPKEKIDMRRSILSKKRTCYVIYKSGRQKKVFWFEPTPEFVQTLEEGISENRKKRV
jgi:hypothetical protein